MAPNSHAHVMNHIGAIVGNQDTSVTRALSVDRECPHYTVSTASRLDSEVHLHIYTFYDV